ncbi:hypothetical protein E2320_012549 [Naja naja]|nr:hypothetical protein E2320_012549 [Naja naja]
MVEKSLAVAVHLVLVSAFWLLCPTLVDSTPSICPRCPADPEFLQKIRLQIMWLKQPTRELYKSYLTGMDLQDELHKFCEVPVAWVPRRNITKEPEGPAARTLRRCGLYGEGSEGLGQSAGGGREASAPPAGHRFPLANRPPFQHPVCPVPEGPSPSPCHAFGKEPRLLVLRSEDRRLPGPLESL